MACAELSSLRMDERFDVIVIGAGVIGASVALECARSGRRVLCVDAGPAVGGGSTSSSSAIIRFNYSTLDPVLTAWEAADRWKRFGEHLGAVGRSSGLARYVETGCLALDSPGGNREQVLALFRDVGVPYEDLSASEIAARFPALATGDFWPPRRLDDPSFGDPPRGEIGGYYTAEGGFIDDPMLAAQNFMEAARAHGAELRLRTVVTALVIDQGTVRGVTVDGGEVIAASSVVNAAGPASSLVNAMAGVTPEMRITNRPLRQEVHVLEAPPEFDPGAGCLVADPGLGVYFRPGLGGTVLIGGVEPECDDMQWVEDPGDFVRTVTVDIYQAQVYRAARRLPELRIPPAPTGLADLYDVSDDWVPLYDKTSVDGFFLACGTSGNQFKNAPMVGEFLVALIDARDAGHDHDADPVRVRGAVTGREIDLGAFSRLRDRANTSNSVFG